MYEIESLLGITDADIREAVVVAAHPDDEILWFSGILNRVKRVVICYLHQESRPKVTAGRLKVLGDFPLATIHSLNLNLSDVFGCANWQHPCITSYGLDISHRSCSKKKYEANFERLRTELQELLRPYTNVFTHNPWGEYGHEEHVQVFRVIEGLQDQMGFALWVPNYVSNRSIPLMMNSKEKISNSFFRVSTDKILAAKIKDLYQKQECWTWYSDFQWKNEEIFLKVNPAGHYSHRLGRSFPLNFLDVGERKNSFLIEMKDKFVRFMRASEIV